MLSFCTLTFSQEKDSEKIEITEINDETDEVPFAVIDEVPVYKGCSENLENESQKKCMAEGISNHVIKNFNIKIAENLGLPNGVVRVNVIFKVGRDGIIFGIMARAPKPELEAEAIRVIKLIPKLTKPGYQRGQPVTVPYSLPIIFKVANKPLSKKELKKLKRKVKRQTN